MVGRGGRSAVLSMASGPLLKAFDGVDETGRWTTHPPNDALWCSTSTRSSPFPQGGGDIPHTRDRGPCVDVVSRTMLTDCKYRLSRTHFARRCSWLQESQSGECFCVSERKLRKRRKSECMRRQIKVCNFAWRDGLCTASHSSPPLSLFRFDGA